MKQTKLYPKWEDVVEFGADGPVHKKLVDTPGYKSVIVGMEKAQSIPPHAAKTATYHFLQGSAALLTNLIMSKVIFTLECSCNSSQISYKWKVLT